ncbi:helix-turn-helix transcriptional regulator [Pedobacter nutrimenti]|uniref:helix-turn-helix transcriptional regulator n=1 Tax=Pedobacter nutrimenti TaxID=1241337 RepID=UPI002930F585|nr:helix-turn-helix transcriptional regulator [Pedobacter nutrimenti]
MEKIRTLRGFSQAELADYLKKTRQAISKIEKSDTKEEDKLIKIAEALGVSVEAIETFNE